MVGFCCCCRCCLFFRGFGDGAFAQQRTEKKGNSYCIEISYRICTEYRLVCKREKERERERHTAEEEWGEGGRGDVFLSWNYPCRVCCCIGFLFRVFPRRLLLAFSSSSSTSWNCKEKKTVPVHHLPHTLLALAQKKFPIGCLLFFVAVS